MPKAQSPLAAIRRKSSSQSSLTGARRSKIGKDDGPEQLEDAGGIVVLAPPTLPQQITDIIHYIKAHAFAEMPDRGAGMNSERISEILRFRQGLPPVTSIAHLHALSVNSTNTERQLAQLVKQGVVRRIAIPGRGKGGAAIGEGIVLVSDWKECVKQSGVKEDLHEKYFALMDNNRASYAVPTSQLFTPDDVAELVRAGLLTNPSALSASARLDPTTTLSTNSQLNIANAGARATTGTLAAIGGSGAIHNSGGGGSTLATKEQRGLNSLQADRQSFMAFSLPSMGPYLKLVTECRHHLLHLIKMTSPRHREATISLLREKWDGNVAGDAVSVAKRIRGEFSGKLPGQTRKWRDFYGMQFVWVLEECVGAGLLEPFQTGSVGIAVRTR